MDVLRDRRQMPLQEGRTYFDSNRKGFFYYVIKVEENRIVFDSLIGSVVSSGSCEGEEARKFAEALSPLEKGSNEYEIVRDIKRRGNWFGERTNNIPVD